MFSGVGWYNCDPDSVIVSGVFPCVVSALYADVEWQLEQCLSALSIDDLSPSTSYCKCRITEKSGLVLLSVLCHIMSGLSA